MFWLNSIKFSKLVNSEHSLLPNEVEWIWILDRIPSQNICIMHTIGSNSPFWLFFDKFYSSLTSDDFLWPDMTSNNFEYQFPTKFWVETYVYLIYFDQPGRFDAYWTDLTLVWPLMTFCDLIWPQIILNFNFRQNCESKHMYIWCISTWKSI